MNKVTKTICLIAAGMIAFGIVMTGAGFILGGNPENYGPWSWNGRHLTDEEHFNSPEMKHVTEPLDAFHSVRLDVAYQIIEFRESDSTFELESIYNPKYSSISFGVQDGTLVVSEKTNRKLDGWLFRVNDVERMKGKLIITYPKGTDLKDFTIDVALGDLDIYNINLDKLDITADMGSVDLSGIQASVIDINAAMGDITIENSVCETAVIDCDMGAIESDRFTVQKSFTADAAMGDVNLNGDFRGRAEVDCDMGSISVELAGSRSEYQVDASVSVGTVEIDGDRNDGWGDHVKTGTGPNVLKASNSMGDIEVEFDAY